MPRQKATPEELIERFWAKVVKGPDCWSWTGSHFDNGYAAFHVDRKPIGAHRIMYQLVVGPIPDGNLVHHQCENKGCINPDHLEAVTQREHGRHQPLAKATHCKRGHEFTRENTRWQGPEKQWRACATCQKESQERAEEKRRLKRAGQRIARTI